MPNIHITVAEKIATNTSPGEVIVCGNSDYTITFDLDDEWTAEPQRVARFVFYKNGLRLFREVVFTGDTVLVPVLSGVDYVLVGVHAGDLRTTTPAKVLCDRSILCGDPVEALTEADKQSIMEQLAAHVYITGAGINEDGHLLLSLSDGRELDAGEIPTPVKGEDYYTDADKAEMVTAVVAALPKYAGEVVV